jgi:hypothetical protein
MYAAATRVEVSTSSVASRYSATVATAVPAIGKTR